MWGWVASSALLGGAVLFSYAAVLFDAFGGFPLPVGVVRGDYLDSPYWLGLPRSSVASITAFQIMGGIGYVVWFGQMLAMRPTRGLLAEPRWLVGSTALFLVPSIVWPYTAHRLLHNFSVGNAVLASVPLWGAAIGMALLVGGTFEDERSNPLAIIGILLVANVVVCADAMGWSACAIYRAVHHQHPL